MSEGVSSEGHSPSTLPDPFLIDTDILLRVLQPSAATHFLAINALNELHNRGCELWVATQSLYEFWVVATRPVNVNGLGATPEMAEELISEIRLTFMILPERPLYQRWIELVTRYKTVGKPAHDARLVAAMREAHIKRLLTFNTIHFERYKDEGIIAHHPQDFQINPSDGG